VALLTEGYPLEKPNEEIDSVTFLWGNMKEPGVLVDYYTMRMVQNLRLQMMKLSDELIAKGEKAKAIEILDKTFEVMPVENEQVPAGDISHYLCANYYEAGDTVKGDLIGKTLVNLQLQKLNHYTNLDDKFVGYVWSEIGKSLTNLEMLREASLVDLPRASMFEIKTLVDIFKKDGNKNLLGLNFDTIFSAEEWNSWSPQQQETVLMKHPDLANGGISFGPPGVLEGTDYDQVCAKVRKLFFKNYSKKPNFFTNPQKFPVLYTQLWGGQMN